MLTEAPPAANNLPGVDQAAPQLSRRDRKRLKKAKRGLELEQRITAVHEQLFPDEKRKLSQYDPFIEQVEGRGGDLDPDENSIYEDGARLAATLIQEPYYVRREVENRLRRAARNAGENTGKLRAWRHSSVGECLSIFSNGTLPASSTEVRKKIDEEKTDPEKTKHLATICEALEIDEKTGGRRGNTLIVEVGPNVSIPIAGVQAQIGIERQTNPETGENEHDIFIAGGGRILHKAKKRIKGRYKSGVEETTTAVVASRSKGHPYRKDQDKGRAGFIEIGAGKLNTILLEPPPPALIAAILPPKYFPFVHLIQSIGYLGWLKPHIAVTTNDERFIKLQKVAASLSVRTDMRMEPVKEKVRLEPIKERVQKITELLF